MEMNSTCSAVFAEAILANFQSGKYFPTFSHFGSATPFAHPSMCWHDMAE
jgi:hypothetical protein